MDISQYRGLIFDLDGTLIATDDAHNYAWKKALNQHGLEYDSNLRDRLGGAPTLTMAEQFLVHVNSNMSPEQLVQEKNEIVKSVIFEHSTYLPLINLVKKEYGRKKMAVGTGSSEDVAIPLLKHLKLYHYFDAVVTANDVQKHKPKPDTFLRCAELIGVSPEECLVFEDAEFGIQAAQSAGMDVVDVRKPSIQSWLKQY